MMQSQPLTTAQLADFFALQFLIACNRNGTPGELSELNCAIERASKKNHNLKHQGDQHEQSQPR